MNKNILIQISKLENNIQQGKCNAKQLNRDKEIHEAYYNIYSSKELNEGAIANFFKKIALTAVVSLIAVNGMSQTPIKPSNYDECLKEIVYGIRSELKVTPKVYESRPSNDEEQAFNNFVMDVKKITSKEDLVLVTSMKTIIENNEQCYTMFFITKKEAENLEDEAIYEYERAIKKYNIDIFEKTK